jgi:hypothetical protein
MFWISWPVSISPFEKVAALLDIVIAVTVFKGRDTAAGG